MIEEIVNFLVAKLIVEGLEPVLKYHIPISKHIERLIKPRNPKRFRMRQIKRSCKS